MKPRLLDEAADKSKNSKLAEITDITQCRSLRLPDTLPAGKASCARDLIYTPKTKNLSHIIVVGPYFPYPRKFFVLELDIIFHVFYR